MVGICRDTECDKALVSGLITMSRIVKCMGKVQSKELLHVDFRRNGFYELSVCLGVFMAIHGS